MDKRVNSRRVVVVMCDLRSLDDRCTNENGTAVADCPASLALVFGDGGGGSNVRDPDPR